MKNNNLKARKWETNLTNHIFCVLNNKINFRKQVDYHAIAGKSAMTKQISQS